MSRTRRKTRDKPEVREQESTRQAADMAAMRRMLVAWQGCFSLSFAVCNDRTLRNELVQRLQDEFPGILLVSLEPQTRDVYQVVSDRWAAEASRRVCVGHRGQSALRTRTRHPTLRALNSLASCGSDSPALWCSGWPNTPPRWSPTKHRTSGATAAISSSSCPIGPTYAKASPSHSPALTWSTGCPSRRNDSAWRNSNSG